MFSKNTKKTAFLGLMLALMFVLSAIEALLPPVGPLALRPGLSNIAVMYIIFFVGKKEALLMAVLKSSFVLITRGFMAFCLSISGGILSVLIIVILSRIPKISLLILSIFGAVFHNLGQIMAICLILNSLYYFYYMPLLMITAVGTGSITGISLKYVIPALEKIKS